jgi:serine/threonine-protein kinase
VGPWWNRTAGAAPLQDATPPPRYSATVGDPSTRSAGLTTLPSLPRSLRDEKAHQLDRATDLGPGEVLEHACRYDVVERLGEGGMGKVYKVYDAAMARYLALKVLKLDVPESARRRFRREARVATHFSHPNLVRVLDVGAMPERGLEWMSMEYLRGRDLGAVIDRGRAVALPLLREILVQTLEALHYIHTRRIAHCDIKPENIFLTRDSYNPRLVIVKLIDFGVCRNLDPPLELESQISGDPRYIAPEQQILNGPLDGRADLYALGISIFETIALRHPYADRLDQGIHALLAAQRELPLPALREHAGPDLPEHAASLLDGLLAIACAKRPEDRFTDALAMQQAVRQALGGPAFASRSDLDA